MSNRLAIIPVRTGSKRLPGKNTREFHGRPLFSYAIDCAIESGLFDEIHVSTESEEVAKISEAYGAKPNFMRPNDLATDDATLDQVCEFVLAEYKKHERTFEEFCLLWATAPMRTVEDIRNGYAMLTDKFDAVVGVTTYDLPVYCAQLINEHNKLTPLFPEMLHKPSQEMPEVVCDNGSFCWVKTDAFWRHKTWLLPRLCGYDMPRERSCDIDTEDDWHHAHYLYGRRVNTEGTY